MSFYRSAPRTIDVVVTAFAGRVFGISGADGSILWEVPMGDRMIRVVVEGEIVFALGDRLAQLALADGRELRTAFVGGQSLLVDEERVFVGREGELHAFAKSDLRKLWSQPFRGKGYGHMAIAVPGAATQGDYV
jgi:outer membrane protein assembly factor BamB